jgi:hypothetical protein
MRTAILLLFLTLPALAQSTPASVSAACGPEKVIFTAREADAPLPLASPQPGKALVYFIQDDGLYGTEQHYTVKIGLDGTWVGAYKDNAAFALNVAPGERHICANVQSNFDPGGLFAFAHFTAEPGKVYYFRTRFFGEIGRTSASLNLDQLDSDEAKYLISIYPASASKPKK